MTDQGRFSEQLRLLEELRQRLHLHFLEQLRLRYEGGDKAALPYCLNECMINNLPIPPWLATAFREACRKVSSYEVKSWDEVFGAPVLKGQRQFTLRRNKKVAEPLWTKVKERREAGAKITKELIAEVGAKFRLGATVANDLYYEHKGTFEDREEMFRQYWEEFGRQSRKE
jgi:hypothetical protein